MKRRTWIDAGSLITVLALLCSSGCGGGKGEQAKVKGHVKFFDKDLTAGTVTFTSKDGTRVGSTTIDFSGNYEMNDAPVGDVIITVKTPTFPKGQMPKTRPKPPPGVPEMKGENGEGVFAPGIDPDKIVQIPGKYGSVETSGLTYTVVKGEQTKDIALSP